MAFGKKPYSDLTVLVIDDDTGTRQLIKKMLQLMGVRSIAEANEGKTGLAEVVRTHPDLVLCDVHMGPVDGQDFLRLVRDSKIEWVRKLPVIFLTADATPDTVRQAKEHEVDGYLVKPVSAEDLKKRIDSSLSRAARI
jgi:two-component system chemotaxis response regulator CheY